jgi:predicted alpha-1,6-mannanase (GH76 family)
MFKTQFAFYSILLAISSFVYGASTSSAEEVFTAYNKVFWDPNVSQFREESGSPKIESNFWMAAEEFEMLEDVYEYRQDPNVLKQCIAYYNGFTDPNRFGTDWLSVQPGGHFNDDMIWITIATLRMYQFTGEAKYKDQAKKTFDGVWQRGWDDILGGGIHWSADKNGKTSCVNFPAGIAAVMLSDAFKDETYLNKAKQLYSWSQKNLVDESKRAVWDNKDSAGNVGKVCLTYNQGTYIGLAHLLYKKTNDISYYNDANTAMAFAMRKFTHPNTTILQNEDWCSDSMGFKGIFIRYASKFAREYNLNVYTNWLRENAKTVYANKRGDGLTFTNFNFKCPDGSIPAWSATPGVIIMQTTAEN